MKTTIKHKKALIPLWIGTILLAFAYAGCSKPDDENDGSEITLTDTIQPVDTINPNNPSSTIVGGVLPGLFSVSSEQQIHFSQGNLQYQASTNTWRLAENQWVIIGESNENISPTYNGWIDLFGWGTSGWDCGNTYYQPWDSDNSNGSLYGPPGLSPLTGPYSHSDWGIHNAIFNGGNLAGQWHTLTENDWRYLYYTRNTPSDIRFAMGKVSGVKGVILLPDDWSSSTYTLNNTNQYDASFDSNLISASKWLNELQPNGAVFLPCAGSRHGTSFSIGDNGGAYWSSGIWYLYDGYYGYGEYLPIRYPEGGDFLLDRSYGLAVRLVQSVQNNNNDTEILVITHTPSEISQASACCGCDVLVPIGQTVTEIGVCWSTSPNPTINDYHLSTTNYNEPFVCTITGLTQGTTYYVRAYATNNDGTVYGTQKTFTTFDLTNNDSFIGTWGVEKIEYYSTDYAGVPITSSMTTISYNPYDISNGLQLVFMAKNSGELRDNTKDTIWINGDNETYIVNPDTLLVNRFTYSYDHHSSIMNMIMDDGRNFLLRIHDMTNENFFYENEYESHHVERAYLKRLSYATSLTLNKHFQSHKNLHKSIFGKEKHNTYTSIPTNQSF